MTVITMQIKWGSPEVQNGKDFDPRIFMRSLQLPLGAESHHRSGRDTSERAEILPQMQEQVLEQAPPAGACARTSGGPVGTGSRRFSALTALEARVQGPPRPHRPT